MFGFGKKSPAGEGMREPGAVPEKMLAAAKKEIGLEKYEPKLPAKQERAPTTPSTSAAVPRADRTLREYETPEQRELKNKAAAVLECEPRQIATSQKEVTPDTRAYIGPLFPGIFKLNIENIFTEFPEGRIRNIELEIGGMTKQEYINALKEEGMEITPYAKSLLDNDNEDFTTTENREDVDLVRLTVAGLGFPSGATVKEIYERAQKFGLELCPAEVGPAQRLKDKEQAKGDWYNIAMKPIADPGGYPGVFSVDRVSGGRYLNADNANPGFKCGAGNQWLFRRRK